MWRRSVFDNFYLLVLLNGLFVLFGAPLRVFLTAKHSDGPCTSCVHTQHGADAQCRNREDNPMTDHLNVRLSHYLHRVFI